MLERSDKNGSKISKLEKDKERLEKELATSQSKLADSEKLSAELIAKNDSSRQEILNLTATAHELRGAARKREMELEAEVEGQKAEAERQKAEVEKLVKELEEVKSTRRDELHTAFREGERRATVHYQKQVNEISKIMFEEGCHSVLKELEIPEDHPIHQSLPRCPSPEPDSDSDPAAEAPDKSAPAPAPENAPVPAQTTVEAPDESGPTPVPENAPVPGQPAAEAPKATLT